MRMVISILACSISCATSALASENAKKTRIIDIEGLVIQGEIQRPEAFFIMQRDEQDILSTLTLDPVEDAESRIEELALSELFK